MYTLPKDMRDLRERAKNNPDAAAALDGYVAAKRKSVERALEEKARSMSSCTLAPNEGRLIEILRASAPGRCPWFESVRHATPKQDMHEGVDVIVETKDVGRIYVQVKSSEFQASLFRKKRSGPRYRDYVVLVVRAEDADSDVADRAIEQLDRIRFLRKMRTAVRRRKS